MIYEFNGKAPKIDPTSYLSESASVIGDVVIGPRCYIGPGAVIRADAATILIEEETAIEEGAIIHAGGGGCTLSTIGRRVTIGHGAIVHSDYVGPGASIGMGAIISLNSEIGEGSVVAEGSVVKQKQIVPAGILVGGIPAAEIRQLQEKDIKIWEATKDWYVKMTRMYLTDGMFKRLD